MTDATQFITGAHSKLGDLWAAWNATARHVEPGVRASRFAARLAPFRDRDAAERALLEEGATVQRTNA